MTAITPPPKSRPLDADRESRWQRAERKDGRDRERGKRHRMRRLEPGEGLLLPSHALDPADTPSVPIMAFLPPFTVTWSELTRNSSVQVSVEFYPARGIIP